MEPPVSDPSVKYASPAATAAAEPPLEPPGTRSSAHGLRTGEKLEFSLEPPMANSSMLSLPIVTVSAAFNFSTTVASYTGSKLRRNWLPHVVRSPFVTMLSLIPTGRPKSNPFSSPLTRRSSS
ncbi:hypothetical protein D3C74_406140 [compost metagenome]